LDRLSGPRWDRPSTLVEHADRIISLVSRLDPSAAIGVPSDGVQWQTTVELVIESIAIEHRRPAIEHDLGLGR
jgi:hypothetical protein